MKKLQATQPKAKPKPLPNKPTRNEIIHYMNQGGKINIQLPFEKWNDLIKTVIEIKKLGLEDNLIDRCLSVSDRCYKLMFDESVNKEQRIKQVIDIASYDMGIQAIIWVYGNGVIPERLKDWKPTLGSYTQQKAKSLIAKADVHNIFWLETFNKVVNQTDESFDEEVHNKVLEQNVPMDLPIELGSAKELNLEVLDQWVLIKVNGQDRANVQFQELGGDFWNKRDNRIGVCGMILKDLMNDRDECLKPDGLRNFVFNQTGKAEKQISLFAKSLDGLFQIVGDETKSSVKRWFHKSHKYPEPRWYPNFMFESNKDVNQLNLMDDVIKNEKPLGQIVAEHSYDELKENHINPISIRKERIQNEYQ